MVCAVLCFVCGCPLEGENQGGDEVEQWGGEETKSGLGKRAKNGAEL